ncbi:Trp biosynthesis-associated membrane protein [Myceligenerans indicum]|uniref:Trp biosynthesis-associated membrane protein n=1 Tax=Myceligenerans indicum TaxID=2593663 RepID=A0ABS1LJD5_9MICO|nr:Trp biosynthesis-associated membrane protein [Myceligenerans indicum]MBL0886350.1 Trp biosynthesis-associated membrane protein [Myceligenerans indicum]
MSAPTAAGRRTPLTRTRVLGALVALGGVSLAATSVTWLTTEVATALRPDVAVAATGADAAPAVGAAALVLLACGPALALTGRAGRYVVLTVAALAGAGVSAGALSVIADRAAAGASAAADAAGVTDLTGPVVLTPWPWTTAAAGVLAVLVAVVAAFAARRWPQVSRRHERDGARGDDREPGTVAAVRTGPGTPEPSEADAPGEGPDPADDWDALTRGEDPTRDDR